MTAASEEPVSNGTLWKVAPSRAFFVARTQEEPLAAALSLRERGCSVVPLMRVGLPLERRAQAPEAPRT